MTGVKRTPFNDIHKEYGAKMVEFAGYEMPIQYKGINAEHLRVRKTVGAFDLSHMGEFEVSGPNALAFLQKVTINDVSTLGVYQIHYTAMCYPDGGIVDDLLVYRLPESFYMVINAANIDKDFAWLEENLIDGVTLQNSSDETGLLAIQGPDAQEVMSKMTDCDLDSIGFYHAAEAKVNGHKILFSRTGYTGEDGFELYLPPELCEMMWKKTMESGEEFDIEPIGLGARDSLRLEMKYALYGNDIDKTTNPIEAGLSWICKVDKGDFIGRDAIVEMKENGPPRRLVCFELTEKGVPRKDYKLFRDNQEAGLVTSGIYSPTLEKGIGLGYLSGKPTKSGTAIQVEIRGKRVGAVVVKPPLYKHGSRK